ncbi:MAG: hypothetical protein RIS47_140 [Bacteroidota bacterium]|jgi:pyridoxine 5-phosphate synthase
MTKLSVNINKVATIRNARGSNTPDVVRFAIDAEQFGAQGITVHPRPDERHIRRDDLSALKKVVRTEFNIEGYPSPDFIEMVCRIKPEQVTLVPDPPEAITSSAGWDTRTHLEFLTDVIARFQSVGIRTSIFVDTTAVNIEYAARTKTNRVELYTEPYATNYPTDREKAVAPFVVAAELALSLGLGLNAGHDLSLDNLGYFARMVPGLQEVSIGHALVSDALYLGLEETIKRYKRCLL